MLSIEVVTHDVFPPGVPERLLVVVNRISGKKFVDLIWAPNTEKDLAGYNIYRREVTQLVSAVFNQRTSSDGS